MQLRSLIKKVLLNISPTYKILPKEDIFYSDAYDFFTKGSPKRAEYFLHYIFCLIVKQGDCVIDVGAHVGIRTIPVSKLVGDDGIVIACDAAPKYIEYIVN